MERLPAFEEEEGWQRQHWFFSCWGKLRLLWLWQKLKRRVTEQRRRRGKLYMRRGSLNYDPLSYAQNFDEGGYEEEEENSHRGFSSRFVAPQGPSPRSRGP